MDHPKKIKLKQVILGCGCVLVGSLLLAGGMWMNDPNRGQMSAKEQYEAKKKEILKNYTVNPDSLLSAEESWIAYSEKELQSLQDENQKLREKIAAIESSLKDLTPASSVPEIKDRPSDIPQIRSVDPILDDALPKLSENSDGVIQVDEKASYYASLLPPPPTPVETKSLYPSASALGFEQENKAKEQIEAIEYTELYTPTTDTKTVKNVNNYLPAGTFATAVLLSGVDAPTGGQAGSNPIPVLLRVKHDGQLPNYVSSDVSDCHVLGAAYGDIASERAYIRLEKLTCTLMNGDIIESNFNGYVSGEDGKAGFRGRVVSKNGSMIAKSLMAGVIGGLGESVSQSYTSVATSALGQVQSFNPNKALQSGLGRGASNALEKLADYYIQRANETYPIIEIDAHRIGEIIVLKGADFGDVQLVGHTHQKGQP